MPVSMAQPLTSGNPLVDEIDQAHASLSPGAKQVIDQAHGLVGLKPADTGAAAEQVAAPPVENGIKPPPMGGLPDVAATAPTQSQGISALSPALSLGGRSGQTQAQGKLQHDQTTGSGVSQIHSPWARIPLQILDAIGGGLFPGIEQRLPGTEGHHQVVLNQDQRAVTGEQGEQAAADKSALEQAQATNQEAIPDLKRTAAELAASKERELETGHRNKEDLDRAKNEGVLSTAAAKEAGLRDIAGEKDKATLAQHGFKKDDKGNIVPLEYAEMSEPQQAVHDLKAAQQEREKATADLRKAQAENQPTMMALAQKRLDSANEAHGIATRRLGLSEAQFELRSQGTVAPGGPPAGHVPANGSMLTGDNQPVGTAFQQNVRPTGQERNKADLANSAHDQLQDIKSIVAKRPDIFGPVAGRKTDFTVWLGSQDPDAQRFRAARTIAGDHLAGVFGGRSEAALQALDSAIGHFKDNPSAMQAGLDQLDKANKGFQKAGTVNTAGGNAGHSGPPTVATQSEFDKLAPGTVYIEDGKQYKKPEAKK